MRYSRRQFLQLSALAAAGALLAACAPKPAPTPTAAAVQATATKAEATKAPQATATKAEATKAPEATATKAAAPVGELKEVPRERTFIVTGWSDTGGVMPGFDNWNPLTNAGGALRTNGGNYMFEHLVYRNMNNGTEIPWLAESYSHNEDFTQWTFKIRKGVEWSDGVPFTSKDVKFTIETCIKNAPDLQQSSYLKEWTKEVTCPDDFTVVITLNKPNARYVYPLVVGWEYHFAIVPEHIFKDQDPKTFTNYDPAKGWPVVTGPYKLVSAKGNQLILDRRDDWWALKIGFVKEPPAPERIIVLPGTGVDEVMAQRYITNEIDYGAPILAGTYRDAVKKNPNLRPWFKPDSKILGAPDGCLYQLLLNDMKPPFNDKNVRLAVNYAIDRQKLVDLAYLGSTYPVVVPYSAYIANWVTGDLKKLIDSYDRATPSQIKVEEYMKAAGYKKNASGMWEKDGQTCKFTIRTPDWLSPIGPVVTEQLTAAGFDVTENPDRTAAWGNDVSVGNTEACVMVYCGSNFEPYDSLQYLHSKNSAPIGTALPVIFNPRYANPELDKILEQMEAMIPSREDPVYMDLVMKATKIFLEDMPTIVLAEELHVIPANHTYWTGYPNADDPYVAPYPCWRDIFLMPLHLKPTK